MATTNHKVVSMQNDAEDVCDLCRDTPRERVPLEDGHGVWKCSPGPMLYVGDYEQH